MAKCKQMDLGISENIRMENIKRIILCWLVALFFTFIQNNQPLATQFDEKYSGITSIYVQFYSNLKRPELNILEKNFKGRIFDVQHETNLKIFSNNANNIDRSDPNAIRYSITLSEKCSEDENYCVFYLRTDVHRVGMGALRFVLNCDDVIFSPTRLEPEWMYRLSRDLIDRFSRCVVDPVIKFRKRDIWIQKRRNTRIQKSQP